MNTWRSGAPKVSSEGSRRHLLYGLTGFTVGTVGGGPLRILADPPDAFHPIGACPERRDPAVEQLDVQS